MGALAGSRTHRLGHRVPGTRWWIELGAAALVAGLYLLGPRATPSPSLIARAQEHSSQLLRIERSLGLDIEAAVQSTMLRLHLVVPANWIYGTLHFAVTAATLYYLYRRRPDDYTPVRSAFVVSSVLAFAVYRLWPVTPPRLLTTPGGGTVLVDTLERYPALWTFESGAMSQLANQHAAMPSMHAGWALFCAVAVGLGRPMRTRVALLAYPLLVTMVVMGSGNHYLLDALGGFVVTVLGFAVVAVVRTAVRAATERSATPHPATTIPDSRVSAGSTNG